jgi:hypothetical protein
MPLDLVEPYQKLLLRFVYEVASLAALIRAAADENAPNGQLEPGRVVPRKDGKKGYLVYVGVRRYFALKWLYENTHDPRFAVFNAYVDEGLTELQMFVRAKMENEDEKGERQGLSVLEEVFGLFKIRDSVSPEKLDGELRREFAVAEKIDEERAERLFRVESAAHFRFRLAHLESLCTIEDDREFYLSAACAAGFNIGADHMEEAVKNRDSAYLLEWFRRLFPEFKEPEKAAPTQQSSTAAGSGNGGGGAEHPGKEQEKKPLEVHKKAAIILPCPVCSTEKMILLSLKVLVTEVPIDPRVTGKRGIPDSVVRYQSKCDACPKEFYAFVEPLGGRRYAAETSISGKFREPKRVVEAVDLRADYQEDVWQKIVEGKVVGTVGPHRPTDAGK